MELGLVRLPRCAPAAEGVSGRGIASFLDALEARRLQLHSFMLLRRGHVVAEGWWRPYRPHLPHPLFSLSKSFTSTAVGLAIHEGRLSLDDPVTSLFPDDLPATVGPNLAAMRVRHLLSMATGHEQDTLGRMRAGPSWIRAFLALEVEHRPGSKFVYNNGATYMLSAIVQRLTGQTLLAYLQPRLLQPLGIRDATWGASPEGVHFGAFGLSLQTEDIACFGQLLLQEGRWDGRPLVPAAWIREATSTQVDNAGAANPDWAQGYGFQFWRCRHGAFRGDGAHGQFCVVMPAAEAVLATTGGTDDMQGVLDCVWEHLLPALGGGEGDPGLHERLGALSLAPAGGPGRPGPLAGCMGRTWRLLPNGAGIGTLALEQEGDRAVLLLVQGEAERRIACGWGRWEEDAGSPEPCAGHAVWERDGTLRLDWYALRGVWGRTLRLWGGPDVLEGEYRTNVGEHARGVPLRAT
jgi:CubicO group peptidase (beta-lactamase class C family)